MGTYAISEIKEVFELTPIVSYYELNKQMILSGAPTLARRSLLDSLPALPNLIRSLFLGTFVAGQAHPS